MILRRSSKDVEETDGEPKGFDAYELRLGDMMRGERATLGKSLLDVQRELRIKAAYIAAIENCDPEAFDTPGFIAGYVRSYARYLNMDPDRTFAAFCAESGFQVAHGMSAEASVVNKSNRPARPVAPVAGGDIFAVSKTPFVPAGEAFLSRIEPGAIGSVLVLVSLIGGIAYGGWTVLQEVQRVQVVPVDQTPVVLSDIDPLAGATGPQAAVNPGDSDAIAPALDDNPDFDANRAAALDRLYRPQALDVPVLVARDAPIATIDPRGTGAFAHIAPLDPMPSNEQFALIDVAPGMAPIPEPEAETGAPNPVPQVVEELGPTVRMVAAYPSWVRVRSAEGATLFEGIMEPGDTFDVPALDAPPTLRTGESGAIYFALGADCFGPVGARGQVTSNVALDRVALADTYQLVDPANSESPLNRMYADLQASAPEKLPKLPCQTN